MMLAPARTNGQSGPVQIAPPALPKVTAPTMTVHVSGHLRLQVPASAEVQALYDLFTADMKQKPHQNGVVAQEAGAVAQNAAQVFNQFLQSSPMLKPVTDQIQPSFGNVDGKLYYIFLLPVRTG